VAVFIVVEEDMDYVVYKTISFAFGARRWHQLKWKGVGDWDVHW
jgi:hypothetical protein